MAESQNSNNNGKHRFQGECDLVLQFLKEYTPKGRGLVIFSDSLHDFWWQRELQVEVSTGFAGPHVHGSGRCLK